LALTRHFVSGQIDTKVVTIRPAIERDLQGILRAFADDALFRFSIIIAMTRNDHWGTDPQTMPRHRVAGLAFFERNQCSPAQSAAVISDGQIDDRFTGLFGTLELYALTTLRHLLNLRFRLHRQPLRHLDEVRIGFEIRKLLTSTG